MGRGASQTGACGLAARAPHLLVPVSQPPLSFLTGTWPNITRNAIVNCAEMVTYDVIKEKLLDYHLFTGEALHTTPAGSVPQQGGNLQLHVVGTTQRQLGFRKSREESSSQHIIVMSRKKPLTGNQGPGFQTSTTSYHVLSSESHLL